MDKMIPANRCQIAISGKNNDVQLRVGKLDPCCKSQCPPVGRVERIGGDVPGCPGRTADS